MGLALLRHRELRCVLTYDHLAVNRATTMKKVTDREIRITGVPLDLGASRRGTDVGPSALRIAGLGAQLRSLGYSVAREPSTMSTSTPRS